MLTWIPSFLAQCQSQRSDHKSACCIGIRSNWKVRGQGLCNSARLCNVQQYHVCNALCTAELWCVCVYAWVCLLPWNLLPTSFIRHKPFYKVLYGGFNVFTVWLSLKTLRSRVLASFAGHCRLPRSLVSFWWTNRRWWLLFNSKSIYG